MIEQPSIPGETTALIFNDMINANLRSGNSQRDRLIAESGLIANAVSMVTAARQREIPIIWIRVERRADRKDVVDTRTDISLASGQQPRPPVVRGTDGAANIDELPVSPFDDIILKPRFDPFIGTGLDLLLRARRIKTILLGGYSTNIGVESCARTAHDLGYDVVLLSDCCFNVERELHEWALVHSMPNFARVMPSQRALDLLR